jgi:hypothetical protein
MHPRCRIYRSLIPAHALQNSFSRALGFTRLPREVDCEAGGVCVAMAVAGDLNFCILAEFDSDEIVIGYESRDSVQMAADALKTHEFSSSSAHVVSCSDNSDWRILSWRLTSPAALKSFTVCAECSAGPGVGVGWIGAVAVSTGVAAIPVAPPADFNSIVASAVALRKLSSFDCASEHETCDIQCLWTLPSTDFFPSVDVYLVSGDPSQAAEQSSRTLIWHGRSASGVFIICDALLSLPMHVLLTGTTVMLQRVALARVPVSAPFIASTND